MPKVGKPENGSSGKAISKIVPGPAHIRHYPAYHLITWQPHGILDDNLLDQIAEWLFHIERVSLPFNRFVDFSRLTSIALRTRHVFNFAQRRRDDYPTKMAIRTALFCHEWVGFGVARFYESLMENTPVEARAFRLLEDAAAWIDVPKDVLTLADTPAPHAKPNKRPS